jgi:2-polyprenyl-3-methyl-5-hydroxy-6-metoxy-1,4-benzoquinol methylase
MKCWEALAIHHPRQIACGLSRRNWNPHAEGAGASCFLDLGCGHGVPISQTLIEEGFTVFGVDASRTLIEAFRKRFPNAFVECAGVEDSEFFQRTFDGVVACGLIFLMPEDTQSFVIHKVARALNPNGRFLFISPKEIVTWRDALTDRESLSGGSQAVPRNLACGRPRFSRRAIG